jgi:hypothetical protein
VALRGAAGPVHELDRNKDMSSRVFHSPCTRPQHTQGLMGGLVADGGVGRAGRLAVAEGWWAGEVWGCRAGAWHCSNLS